MRCFIFAASLVVWTPAVAASLQVPGRDLLDFPIGNLAEGAALATASGDGFRNPATAVLGLGERARFSASAISSPSVMGLSAQAASISATVPRAMTATLSIVRASVDGLFRTESDPQSIGEVPYNTVVVSGGLSRRESSFLTGGVALRYRTGTIDFERRATLGIDGGVVLRGLPVIDGRLGVSTFLWTPTGGARERMTISGATDMKVIGPDSLRQARFGGSWSYTKDYTDEKFLMVGGRMQEVEARASFFRIFSLFSTESSVSAFCQASRALSGWLRAR